MAYQDHNPYGHGYPQQQYPNAQYNGYIDPRHTSKPPAHTYAPYNQDVYHTNGHISHSQSFQTAPNSTHQRQYAPQTFRPPPPPQQHQQPVSNPNQQRAPQPQEPKVSQTYLHRPPQSQQQRAPYPNQQRPPRPQQQQAYVVDVPVSSSVGPAEVKNGHVHMSAIHKQAPPSPPLDFQLLLLSLADEYFAAAYGGGSITDIVRGEVEMQEYYKLIATGLGCLEALLKQCKLVPEREANVRLHYATVLYEETENTMEAEEALSKGISICDRYKYFDLKYNMQHLLGRVMFQRNAKAAFKFLERALTDAQAYQHIAWVYAFRFLKASLYLELGSHQDLTAALTQQRAITKLASEHGDKAVLATATTMEALVCLREFGESEGFEQAQRALASVRSLQLDPAVGDIPQLTIFTSFVDISCHLQRFDPAQALSAMQNMQTALANIVDGNKDGSDGSFAIPLSSTNTRLFKSENSVIRRKPDGSLVLMFHWMPNEDIYNVGFLMSGIAMSHKNTTDGHKSEQMLTQGVQRQNWAQKASNKVVKSVLLATRQQSWREHMAYYMRLHLAFTLASRTSWSSANEQKNLLGKLRNAWPDVSYDLFLLTQYLKGTIAQGAGDLPTAFCTYQSIMDTICPAQQYPQGHQSHAHLKSLPLLNRDIYLLSTLNFLQIIRIPHHPNHHQCGALLSAIAPLCTNSPSRGIVSAYHLISAACPMSSTIITTKQSLQSALHAAKATSNNQLMCMVLNIMSWKFFSGVIGEQADKSARASLTLAKKGGDSLWSCVAAGVLTETLEAAGRIDEAEQARIEGEKYAKELPDKIQEAARQPSSQEDTIMNVMRQSFDTAIQG